MNFKPYSFHDVIPKRYHDQIREVKMPVLSNVIQRLMWLTQGDDLSVNFYKIIELIRHDAVLSHRLIKMSHSVIGGSVNGDLEHAVKLMGITRLRDLIVTIGAVSSFEKIHNSLNLWKYWVSAATRAKFSVYVSLHIANSNENDSFTLCLVQSIGRLVIGCLLPDVQEKIIHMARKIGHNYHESALDFQLNDVAIANVLLRSWDFPGVITSAIENQYVAINEMSSLTAIGQIVHVVIDAGQMMRLPGDYDEPDVGRLGKLLDHVKATKIEHSQWHEERSLAYESACSLINCFNN